jgi:hypothetical protein
MTCLFDSESVHYSKNHIKEIGFDIKIEASVDVVEYFNITSNNGLELGYEE